MEGQKKEKEEEGTAHMSVMSGRLTTGEGESARAAERVPTSARCLDGGCAGTDAAARAAFEEGVAAVVGELVPHLRGAARADLVLEYFKQGITNKLVCVAPRAAPDDDARKCLVRVFGSRTEFVIDRAHELVVLTEHPMAPRLYGRFANGYVVQYSAGHTLALAEARDAHVGALVAQAVRRLHAHGVRGVSHAPGLHATMRLWLGNLRPRIFADAGAADKQALFDAAGGWAALAREVAWHERGTARLRALPAPCLCHNDLLLGNILYDPPPRDTVTLIDFEYCAYGYAPHDIANHFCEWAGFECAWDRYPTAAQQARWLRAYLGAAATDAAVAHWLRMVRWFELSSHLFWGIWAFLQGALSTIDFPYVPYAHARLTRYYVRKQELLNEWGEQEGAEGTEEGADGAEGGANQEQSILPSPKL